jgi:hypothetical protein
MARSVSADAGAAFHRFGDHHDTCAAANATRTSGRSDRPPWRKIAWAPGADAPDQVIHLLILRDWDGLAGSRPA